MNANDVLGGLVERATKLPWSFRIFGVGDNRAFDIQGQAGEPCVINWQGFDDSGRTMDGHQDNGDLIVAAVNALPLLLEVVAEARYLNEETFELLDGEDLCNTAYSVRRLIAALARLDEGVRHG